MIVRLFYREKLTTAGQELIFDEKQSHYLGHVLRLRSGDVVYVFDGENGEFSAQILNVGKSKVTAVLQEKVRNMSFSPDVWLLFAPLKKDKTDMVVQKATELGVRKIMPVLTAYTNAETVRTERFETQSTEAAEQCRRLDVPEICSAQTLDKVLAGWDKSRTLFFLNERGKGEHILTAMSGQQKAALLIGPEGGFSVAEADKLTACPFVKSISLGQRILRAETAAVAALSCWQAVNGDW